MRRSGINGTYTERRAEASAPERAGIAGAMVAISESRAKVSSSRIVSR